MPMNVERFTDKAARHARVSSLKQKGVKHVCQHTTVAKTLDDAGQEILDKQGRPKWHSVYCVSYPPMMASVVELVESILDKPAIDAAESEGLPDLYKYREELQKIEDACSAPDKHTPEHSHSDACFKQESRAGEAMAELEELPNQVV